tara:strand:+ start:2435 stop:3181 length:747 start_codon:yes stop_codon:yes gene_type:complete
MVEIITMKDSDGKYAYKYYEDSSTAGKRVLSMFEKEEGTIYWLRDMGEEDILYDIGSNIGLYTIYGAKRVKYVYSFEPHLGSANSLLRNISLNELENVTAFSCALHNESGFFNFYYDNFKIGGSNNQLDAEIHRAGGVQKPVATELKYAVAMDDLIQKEGLEPPTHVKIDVDGNELKVLKGMDSTLRGGTIKSMIVEYNLEFGPQTEGFLKEYGYILKESQLTKAGKKKKASGMSVHQFAHNSLYEKL